MSRLLSIVIWLTALALAVFVALPQAYNAGLLEWTDVQAWLGKLVPILLVGGGLSLLATIGLFVVRRPGAALMGILIGVLAFIPVYSLKKMKGMAAMVPMIHDITTDTQDPPQFIALAGKRAKASNPDDYDGEQTAQQLKAYPDLKTFVSDKPMDDVFTASVAALEAMGIDIVDADRQGGQIEGTATTKWFRFKDDVIIRLRQNEQGVAVDMRSKSRVGTSDLGTNAKRIRRFMQLLEAKLED
jgi:uncharacterized protein DUF1499